MQAMSSWSPGLSTPLMTVNTNGLNWIASDALGEDRPRSGCRHRQPCRICRTVVGFADRDEYLIFHAPAKADPSKPTICIACSRGSPAGEDDFGRSEKAGTGVGPNLVALGAATRSRPRADGSGSCCNRPLGPWLGRHPMTAPDLPPPLPNFFLVHVSLRQLNKDFYDTYYAETVPDKLTYIKQ